jgi:hypothetical protein
LSTTRQSNVVAFISDPILPNFPPSSMKGATPAHQVIFDLTRGHLLI